MGRLSVVQLVTAAVAVVVIAFVVLLAGGDVQSNDANFDLVGQPAPPVQGISYDGADYNLDATLQTNRSATLAGEDPASGTWVVVNFFASWCVGCVEEHDDLTRLHEEGVVGASGQPCSTELVGIAFNDADDDVADFFDRLGGDWPVLVGDGTSTMAIDYSVLSVPETLVIRPDGLVIEKWAGAVTYEQLAAAIQC